VFIIGGARTGSEMLKTMLYASPDMDFVDELFLLCPKWLHKDFWRNVSEHVGDLADEFAAQRLVDLVFSGIPYGWVYTVANQKFDRNLLVQLLQDVELSPGNVLAALMKSHAARSGKNGLGAKFPLHYGDTDKLIEWFPNCKLIHTTRDPRAVYASQANKYLSRDRSKLSNSWMRFRQFIHINIQISWTAAIHARFRSSRNYRLVRYEDVVTAPENQIRHLCEFLNIDFNETMLAPEQYGSSYSSLSGQRGVSPDSLDAWRDKISPLTASSIWNGHRRARKLLGYDELA